jgi:hypothetical protein
MPLASRPLLNTESGETFDIKRYERKLSYIGGEIHITNITDAEADQIVEYAKAKGVEAVKMNFRTTRQEGLTSQRRQLFISATLSGAKRRFLRNRDWKNGEHRARMLEVAGLLWGFVEGVAGVGCRNVAGLDVAGVSLKLRRFSG